MPATHDSMPVALFWSTGKDSALTLHALLQNTKFSVQLLILTINKRLQRVSMHGVPLSLAMEQIRSAAIPAYIMETEDSSTNNQYEQAIEQVKKHLRSLKISHVAFGDIFLPDLQQYRKHLFENDGFTTLFPLWGKNTRNLIEHFINSGFKARIVCCDASLFPRGFCGREINDEFLRCLPEGIDPCGENGEFHTFCYAGPVFRTPIRFHSGSIVEKNYKVNSGNYKHYYFLSLDTQEPHTC